MARETLSRLFAAGDRIAVAPQVIAEFIHVVTDSRRIWLADEPVPRNDNPEWCE